MAKIKKPDQPIISIDFTADPLEYKGVHLRLGLLDMEWNTGDPIADLETAKTWGEPRFTKGFIVNQSIQEYALADDKYLYIDGKLRPRKEILPKQPPVVAEKNYDNAGIAERAVKLRLPPTKEDAELRSKEIEEKNIALFSVAAVRLGVDTDEGYVQKWGEPHVPRRTRQF
jgi:hypothetical protein